MNVDELLKVSDGLSWVSDRLSDLPENKTEAITAVLYCQMARLVVVELAHHLLNGIEPYEALRRTAAGELPISDQQMVMMKILTAKPTQ